MPEIIDKPEKGECGIRGCPDRVTNVSINHGIREDGSTYGIKSLYCYAHYMETMHGLNVLTCKHCEKIILIKIGEYYGNDWDGKWNCCFCKKDNEEGEGK